MARAVGRRWASRILMVASGFAGLGYQIVWTQQAALWLGHEAAAVLAAVAAFFGGLAVGALVLGAPIARSTRPVRWYARCELVTAAWSLLLVFAMPPLGTWLVRLTGAQPAPVWQWSVAFFGTFVVLLPATAAMGATLPAMERIAAQVVGDGPEATRASWLGGLYAGNTFGAVAGVLAAAFWLVPAVGLSRTSVICVLLNLGCGVVALLVFHEQAGAAAHGPSEVRPRVHASAKERGACARAVLLRLGLTGFLGIGYEVVVVRVLSQVSEDTVYTFALLLAVYLVGSAAGAAGYQRFSSRLEPRPAAAPDDAAPGPDPGPGPPDLLGDRLLGLLAGTCLAGMTTLWAAEAVRTYALHGFGRGAIAAIAAEAMPAVFAFGPPTIAMGALFCHLARRAQVLGVGFGRALGVNTLGAAIAPAVFGLVALPALGPKLALLAIPGGYVALAARRAWRSPMTWLPAGGALALGSFAPVLAFVDLPAGGRLVRYEDGIMAAVSVVEDADGVARLRIDNRQQEGSSATSRVDARQAWLPLLLHPAPRKALFLGLGTGITASAAADDPTLEVDAVELLPEVIAASVHFKPPGPSRLRVMVADARRYVRTSDRSYDVIVSDNFHPARSGSGSLYTVEHFEAVRLRLERDGVFCQWLPLHQLDLGTLRSIVRSFLVAYPQGTAVLASNSLATPVVGLIGRSDGNRFDAGQVRSRLAHVAPPDRLTRLGLEDELAVLGSFIAGPQGLRRFAADAAINSDDHPVVAYRAPSITYAPDSSPADRLIALLGELALEPEQVMVPTGEAEWPRRLAAYWAARDRFVASGRNVRPSAEVQHMLAQVREPLLSVLRISPDFRPAYDPLLSMAMALARSDVTGARSLLAELTRIQPARAEAPRGLALLDAEPAAISPRP